MCLLGFHLARENSHSLHKCLFSPQNKKIKGVQMFMTVLREKYRICKFKLVFWKISPKICW